MQTNEPRNQSGRNRLEIDAKLMNSDIATEEMLTDTAKGTQKGSQASPQALNGVGMNFTKAIAIIVSRPLFRGVRNRRALAVEMVVTVVFIGKDLRRWLGKLMDMLTQGFAFSILHDAQTDLSAAASNRSQHRWTVIGKGAASPTFVGTLTRWVSWREVFYAFFPPAF